MTQESARRVPGSWLPAAVHGGLVIQRERTFAVWDPRTGSSGPRLGLEAIIGSQGDLVAGCAPGSGCTRIALQDAATLRTVEPRLESEDEIALGAAVVDTSTGRATVVPGSSARHYPELSWAASSEQLRRRLTHRVLNIRAGLTSGRRRCADRFPEWYSAG